MKMSYSDVGTKLKYIFSKITGFSIPLFGISWNPPTSEIDVANRLITYLEDKRVLTREAVWSQYVDLSVLNMRQTLTEELQDIDRKSSLAKQLQTMRTACREFVDQREKDPALEHFETQIMKFQQVLLFHIGQICAKYGIDLETPLADQMASRLEMADKEQLEKLAKS
ncbi:MAG: DUF6650 family protein [Acidiferrobacterales bacterium]